MLNSDLNLARKWRSKSFDQIIGQDLCVRILKNSLYLNSFFPVYLFSGQRGSGKTSTARIFATAINCIQLENFQKDAKSFSVPCFECNSCKSMQLSKHPDFIEIDAASHTGVDNIRNIIEASTLLPLIGRKKIYLIDEAHMLSKAAFNAFLKILEEPPASVLFILATTDIQKIIDTVRSRSFQLFFSSISEDILLNHLEFICKSENINYEIEGLSLIANEANGSARDAINLLEQIRFGTAIIDKKSVLNNLGHLSDDQLLNLFDYLINKKNLDEFLKFLDENNFYSFSAEFIWDKLLELLRASIRIKFSVNTKLFYEQRNELNNIISNVNVDLIIELLNEFCKNELLFFKAINKNLFLELFCLRILGNDKDIIAEKQKEKTKNFTQVATKANEEIKHETKANLNLEKIDNSWQLYINEIKKINEPLVESVFAQANFIKFDEDLNVVNISFSKKFVLFKDLLNDKINCWLPILKKCFNSNSILNVTFDDNEIINNIEKKKTILIENESEKQNLDKKEKNLTKFDYSDKEKWKLTNTLLQFFPGKIVEIQDEN